VAAAARWVWCCSCHPQEAADAAGEEQGVQSWLCCAVHTLMGHEVGLLAWCLGHETAQVVIKLDQTKWISWSKLCQGGSSS